MILSQGLQKNDTLMGPFCYYMSTWWNFFYVSGLECCLECHRKLGTTLILHSLLALLFREAFRSHAGRWIFNTIRTCLWLRSWRGVELFPDHQEHVLKLREIFLLCLNPQSFLVCHNSQCYFTSVEIISNHLNSVSLCCLFYQKQFENVWAEHELTII